LGRHRKPSVTGVTGALPQVVGRLPDTMDCGTLPASASGPPEEWLPAVLRPVASAAEAGESGELASHESNFLKVVKWGQRVNKPMSFGFGGA
jgi:hypothetical protein